MVWILRFDAEAGLPATGGKINKTQFRRQDCGKLKDQKSMEK
jgi:hypothetical protein